MSDPKDALQNLLARVVDAKAGFDVMVDKAEPEFRPRALTFRELHHKHADQIGALVTAHGGTPDRDGSLFASVNKAVVSLRAFFDEIDADVMGQVRNGEAHVLDAFDEAIASVDAERHRTELSEMKTEFETLLAEE